MSQYLTWRSIAIVFLLFTQYTPSVFGQRIHALVIGINQYKNAQINDLNFAAVDAEKMRDFLLNGFMGQADAESIICLLNEQATKKSILKHLQQIANLGGPNDRILLYFSGHGEKGYLLPSDFVQDLSTSYLTFDEIRSILQTSHAATRLIFLNSCFSGSIKPPKKIIPAPASQSPADTSLVFISSRENELSWETSELGQSVFSYYLLAGLSGLADANQDQVVNTEELFYFVRNSTYNYVKSSLQKEQCPVMFGLFDRRMPLTGALNKTP